MSSLAHDSAISYCRRSTWRKETTFDGELMNRPYPASLAAIGLMAMLVACADSTTSPDLSPQLGLAIVDPASPPPPPPIDTLAASVDSDASSTNYFGVTLFLNRAGMNSWLKFDGDGASPNAHLKIGWDGSIKGTGQLVLDGGLLDLSSATSIVENTLKRCEAPVPDIDTEITTHDTRGGKCGDIVVQFGDRVVQFLICVDTPVIAE